MDVLGKVYYPIQFSSKKIFYHPKFEDDLRNLIEKSGFEVLLCNFEEKDKKDYSKAIDLATKRRAEILRGFIEGEKEGKKDG